MTTPTKLGLVIFGMLAVSALLASSLGPDVPMPSGVGLVSEPRAPARIVDMTDPAGSAGTPSGLPVLADRMPDFRGITKWWNTAGGEALTPERLNGKVVLVDFWTYSCINCIRTYPFLRAMHEKYADDGLVIVGVHTPEFAFEKNPANVEREIRKNDLRYPIALDPDYATWNAYANRYWPAEYFFDRQGRLRRAHFGEGEYDESEAAIRALLAETAPMPTDPMGSPVAVPDFSKIVTRETYFGLSRGDAFMGTPGPDGKRVGYTAAATTEPDAWTAGGTWIFRPEYAQADSAGAVFRFSVRANKLHLVLESADGTDKNVEVFVDGKKMKDIVVNLSQLYDIAEFPDAGRHTVELRIEDPGVRFYAATFS